MKHPIGYSRNDMLVYVNLIGSSAATHIAQQPHLVGFAKEALRATALRGPEITLEYDMQRTIGYNFVISTTEKDSIIYAQILRDPLYTRFVKNGKPVPAQHLSLMLRHDAEEGAYELLDLWIGRISPPRPGSANETAESRAYWETHAFVLDNQSLQLRTVTKDCPY
jgi:hypothetical protein